MKLLGVTVEIKNLQRNVYFVGLCAIDVVQIVSGKINLISKLSAYIPVENQTDHFLNIKSFKI